MKLKKMLASVLGVLFLGTALGIGCMMKDEMDDAAGLGLAALALAAPQPTQFTVTIENISGSASFTTPIAPGVYAVHTNANPLFTMGSPDAGQGLEALAEDGDPTGLNTALGSVAGVRAHRAFNTPIGATAPAPAGPGESYSFTFSALPGSALSFATMFVQSNDLFYAPTGAGIPLFTAAGTPMTGDVTSMVFLWDAGTEINQTPGVGADQAPRQSAVNTGAADPDNTVRLNTDTSITYPAVNTVLRVTITSP